MANTRLFDLPNQDIFDFFDLVPEDALKIGNNGSIGVAHSKKDPSKKRVVKLLLKKTPEDMAKNSKAFFNEVQITARLNHPNVVRDVKSAIGRNVFAICTDFYPLKNLASMIPTLPRVAKEFYVSQIACAIHYIHCQGIVHLDLNPRHVLIDVHANAVISDFGNSRLLRKSRKIVVQCGVKGFRAPEASSSMGICPFKADVYSIGALLWNMIFNLIPSQSTILMSLTSDDILSLEEDSLFRHVLMGTLNPSPEGRWYCDRLLHELKMYLPTLENMITRLMDHNNLPPVTNWIETEKLMKIWLN